MAVRRTLTTKVENDDIGMVAMDADGSVVETLTLFPARALRPAADFGPTISTASA